MSILSAPARLTSIVAIDKNGAIGCRNTLPWKLRTDMAFFRSSTLGQSVIMGRKTFDSIGTPLIGRKNIVLSHNWQLFNSTPDCQLALSVPECLARAYQNRSKEVFIIGGAATYLEFAPFVDRYLVTFVNFETPDADAFLATEIRDEIANWDTSEVDGVFSSPERDDHSFKIFEMLAPDADERFDIRQHLSAKFIIEKQRAANPARNSRGDPSSFQTAFAF